MSFGVWLERDSGKAGGRTVLATFSNKRAQKWGAKLHTVLFTLGFMNFGVWLERDSGKAGGRTFSRLSQTRELKSEVRNPTLFYLRLGIMNFGVWLQRDSDTARGRTFSRLSQTRELKSEVRNSTLFYLRLGLWTSESGSIEIVTQRGGGAEHFRDFLKQESSKVRCETPHCFIYAWVYELRSPAPAR